jgi:hypothetical protein
MIKCAPIQLLARRLVAAAVMPASGHAETKKLRVAYAAANLAWPFQAFIATPLLGALNAKKPIHPCKKKSWWR